MFLLIESDNTRWVYIEKTITTACNHLNWQCNRLLRESNQLDSLYNQLKCSSPNLESILRTISTMSCLKLLKLDHLDFNVKINFFSGTLVKLSNELGYLGWEKYPFECLPPSFEPDKLVELILPKSNIKQLWEGTKVISIIIIIFLYCIYLNKQIKRQTFLW